MLLDKYWYGPRGSDAPKSLAILTAATDRTPLAACSADSTAAELISSVNRGWYEFTANGTVVQTDDGANQRIALVSIECSELCSSGH